MDIFKFRNPTHQSKMEQGEIVNNLKSKMWIERYGKEGEFTLVGYASDGLRETLPEGTLISHVDSTEIMMVENHEINSATDKESEIKITGRSIEAVILENRVSVPPQAYPYVDGDGSWDYYQPAEEPHWQIVNLINGVVDVGHVWYASDGVAWFSIYSWIPDTGSAPARYIKAGPPMYDTVMEILKAYNYDLRVLRPGPISRWSGAIPDENTIIDVHKGTDRSATAVFSYDMGEIESADYFWSGKKFKNTAVVQSKWLGRRVSTTPEFGLYKAIMFVDASGVDNNLNAAPTGSTLTQMQNALDRRGQDQLDAQKNINIANVNISKEGTHLTYRKDFFVGDIITVAGEYNVAAKFRVNEYVEIEDENGVSGYPTLALP